MGSTPKCGSFPSSSQTTSSPQPGIVLRGPLSSNPVTPQDVTLEGPLLRSGTFESNSSTATTLVDSSHLRGAESSPCALPAGDLRSSSNLIIHSEINEPENQLSQAPSLTSNIAITALPRPHVKDGVYRSDNASPPDATHAEPVARFTIPWTRSLLRRAPHKTMAKSLMSLFGCICGVVSTLLYTYKSYQLALWQAEQAFYDHCKEWAAKPSELGSEVCSVILKEPLRQPPYVRPKIKLHHHKRDISANQPPRPFWAWSDDGSFVIYLIVVLGVLFAACGTLVLHQRRRQRRSMPAWRDGHTSDSNATWPWNRLSHEPEDVFGPANVRTTPPPPDSLENTHPEEMHLTQTAHVRQVVSALPTGSPDNEQQHAASFGRPPSDPAERPSGALGIPSIHSEALLKSLPRYACASLPEADSATTYYSAAVQKRSVPKTKHPLQVGDALKGRCDDDRVFAGHHFFGFLRRKVNVTSRKKLPFARSQT